MDYRRPNEADEEVAEEEVYDSEHGDGAFRIDNDWFGMDGDAMMGCVGDD